MPPTSHSPSGAISGPGEERRVQARVALALLEGLRDQDRPGEVLDDEDVSVTMPRRFGLSDVVDSQIRRYRREARRHRRVSEAEVRDLIRLVARRPDAGGVFRQVGRSLADAEVPSGIWKVVPGRISLTLARGRIIRRQRALFGGPFLRSIGEPFELEVTHPLLLDGCPGGEACSLVTGFAEATLKAFRFDPPVVTHVRCRSRGDQGCIWTFAGPTGDRSRSAPSNPPVRPG